MPALSSTQANYDTLAHFTQAVDTEAISIPAGENGMILNNCNPETTRENALSYDHRNRYVGAVFSKLEVSIGLEFETTAVAELIPFAQPGTALTLAECASLNPTMVLGAPTDEGFLSVMTNKRTPQKGKLMTGSAMLKLLWLPTDDVLVTLAA